MAYSIRARAVAAALALERQEARQAAAAAAAEAVAAYDAAYLDRHRAAAYLGISIHRLKRLMTAGRAPACIKSGGTKQSHVVWAIDELSAYRADPAAYLAARAATTATNSPLLEVAEVTGPRPD